MVFVDIAGRQNWLEKRLGAWVVRKTNLAGEPLPLVGRRDAPYCVSLGAEALPARFGKPRGVGPCFAK